MDSVIGIDLGTTNSGAAVMLHDAPRTIVNAYGGRTMPSVVSLGRSGEVLVGHPARNQAVSHAEMTARNVKRFMGSGETFSLGDQRFSPEELSAFILEQLKADAEAYLDTRVTQCVITVPAHFSQAQRVATREAGRIAGLEARRIINEPTAAALAYAESLPSRARLVVFDLGGGTFDVTCLRRDGEQFIVCSTLGDGTLGGVDFDRLLLEQVVTEFERQGGARVQEDRVLMQQLQDLVERAKIDLSSRSSTSVALPFFGPEGSTHLTFELTRSLLEELIAPMLHRSVELTMQAMREAGFDDECGIDYLVLAGGSTRIPLVHAYLERALGCRPTARINPDEVVAVGAAIDAHLSRTGKERSCIRDVAGFALGVETDDDTTVTLIRRNTPLPARATETFTTVSDGQQAAQIHVVQGEAARASANTSLGRFLLAGLRAGKRGSPRIRVSFELDLDGIVTVRARDLDSGVQEQTTVVPEFDDQARLERAGDRQAERGGSEGTEPGGELRQGMQRLISQVQSTMAANAGLLESEFRLEIEELLQGARHCSQTLQQTSRLREYQVALEAILGELRALETEPEARNEGA